MPDKIRLGIIGANSKLGWAPRSHLPAIVASPEFELAAVCTTRQESAEETARQYGAKLAFADYREMLAHPDIDAVSVVVRVPSHYEPTKAAIEAGKHVYTEWPLGRDTGEAIELAELARSRGVKTAVGLQARVNPALMYLKDLVESDYIGEVMACHVTLFRDGVLERPSHRTWQRDVTLGAHTLTIANGHTIDALRYVVGDFSQVSAVVSTQVHQWRETDTGQVVDVTSPDNILVSGMLSNGGVASVHVGSIPWAGSGYRMEIYGRQGTLIATSQESPQLDDVRLQVARDNNSLEDLEVPSRYVYVLEGMPKGSPYMVGQMYYQLAQAIHTGQGNQPDFDTAVQLHHFIDNIREASDTGRQVGVTAG